MARKKDVTAQPTLSISKILVPDNIREDGWEKNLKGLADSIAENGLEQPVGVWPLPSNQAGENGETHELVFGHRRLMACKTILKWTTIPVVVKAKRTTAKDRYLSSLVENAQREDLTPIEEAVAFKRGIDEHGLTAGGIAKKRGVSNAYVSQRLALLKMPEPVQAAVVNEDITFTHARAMSSLDEPEQVKLLKQAERLPVAEFKEKVAEKIEAAEKKGKKKGAKRGRPEKTNSAKVRTVSEIKVELGKLDEKKKGAVEKGDKAGEAYYKGMMRGLGWAAGLTKTLY